MPQRKYTYTVEVDSASAAKAAAQLRDVFQKEMSKVTTTTGGVAGATGGGGTRTGGGGSSNPMSGLYNIARLGFYVTVLKRAAEATAGSVVSMNQLGVASIRARTGFEYLSGGATQAAENLEAVRRATNYSVSSMEAMLIANKMMSIGFAESSHEMERLAKFASVSSRLLGKDLTQTFENMGDAIANLSFRRLDQMGVSVTRTREIFETLKGSMDESRAFMLAFLQAGEEGWGDLMKDVGDLQSELEKLIATLGDLKVAWAEAFFESGFVEDLAKNINVRLGGGTRQDFVDELQRRLQFQSERPTSVFDRFQGIFAPGKSSEDMQAERIARAQEGIEIIERTFKAMDEAEARGVPGLSVFVDQFREFETAISTADVSTDQIAQLKDLQNVVRETIEMYLLLSGQIDEIATTGPTRTQAFWSGSDTRLLTYRMQQSGAVSGDEDSSVLQGFLDTMTEIPKIREKEAEAEQKKNEQIARAAEAEWKRAAKAVEAEWDSAIGSIPGLLSPSKVTEEQMELAELGVPQRFADSPIRELADEVINGVERSNVDILEAAAIAGIDPGMHPKGILAEIQRQQATGELWAKEGAMDYFLDADEVKKGLGQWADAKVGQEQLKNWVKSIAGDMDLGIDVANFLTDGIVKGLDPASETTEGFGTDAAKNITASLTSEDSVAVFSGAGVSAANSIFSGFSEEIMKQGWAQAIKSSILADLRALLESEDEGEE